MSTAVVEMIDAKRDRKSAEQRDKEAQERFLREQKIKLFAPIREALEAIRDAGIVFFTSSPKYGRQKKASYPARELHALDRLRKITPETFEFEWYHTWNGRLTLTVRDDLKGFRVTIFHSSLGGSKPEEFDNAVKVVDRLAEIVAECGITD